jgi:type 1 glutamine amidotransferase
VGGGGSGHEPEQGAKVVTTMLEEAGFRVRVETSTATFKDSALPDLAVIVPIYSSLGHVADEFKVPEMREIFRRGLR